MARNIKQGHVRTPTSGAAVSGATVTVYLTGTATPATIYSASSGGSAVSGSQVTTNTNGYYKFFIDKADYTTSQRFALTIEGSGLDTTTYSDVDILDVRGDAISVKDHGAVGDKTINDTTAIQAALTAAGAQTNGGVVFFPEGCYLIDVTSATITVPEGVVLKGVATYNPVGPGSTFYGSTIFVTGTANDAFTLNRGCEIDGLNFWYPDQVTTNPPTAYGWTIAIDVSTQNTQGIDIKNCVLYNPYKGINLGGTVGGNAPGSITIKNVKMCPLNQGIELGQSLTNNVFDTVQMVLDIWTGATGLAVRDYIAANCVGVKVISTDSVQMDNLAIFGLQTGLLFAGGTNDNVTFTTISNSVIDGCRYPVRSESGTTLQGVTFVGTTFQANQFGDNSVFCNAVSFSNTALVDKVMFNGCYFGPCNGTHVDIDMTSGTSDGYYTFSGCQFENAGNNYTGATAARNLKINAANATVQVENCHFKNLSADTVRCIEAASVKDLTILGNKFNLQEDVLSFSGTSLHMALNSSELTQGTYSVGTVTATNITNISNTWDKENITVLTTRPAFHAGIGSAQGPITTAATVQFVDTSSGYDYGSDFNNGTYTFTAPKSGIYAFNAQVTHDTGVVAADRYALKIVTTKRTYPKNYISHTANFNTESMGVLADMATGDTAYVTLERVTGTGGWTFLNDATQSFFDGRLVEG